MDTGILQQFQEVLWHVSLLPFAMSVKCIRFWQEILIMQMLCLFLCLYCQVCPKLGLGEGRRMQHGKQFVPVDRLISFALQRLA